MALTVDRVIGQEVTVTITTDGAMTITDWSKITINPKKTISPSQAAAASYTQKVVMHDEITGQLEGFRSANCQPPKPGDEISAIDMTVVADEVGPGAFAAGAIDGVDYGKIIITSVNYTFGSDPATWTADFESGILNTTP